MRIPRWSLDESWPGPNGTTWEIRSRTWRARRPIHAEGHIVYTSVNPTCELGLFCIEPDGRETFLHSYTIDIPCTSGLDEIDRWRLHDTARRQSDAPVLHRMPHPGVRVRTRHSGDGVVSTWCIHVNEYGKGGDGECQSRGRFSAFVVDLDRGGRIVVYPEEIMVLPLSRDTKLTMFRWVGRRTGGVQPCHTS